MQDEVDAHSVVARACSGAPPHLSFLTLGSFHKIQHLSGKFWLLQSTKSVACRRADMCPLSGFCGGKRTRQPLKAYCLSSSLKGVYDPNIGHPLPQPEATMGTPQSRPLCSMLWGLTFNSLLGISLLPRNHLQSTQQSTDALLSWSNYLNFTY